VCVCVCVCVCAAHYRILFISLLTSATEQIRSAHPDPWSERSKPSFIPTAHQLNKHALTCYTNKAQAYTHHNNTHEAIIQSTNLWCIKFHVVQLNAICREHDPFIVNTRSWPKMDAPLDGKNNTYFLSRGASIFLYWQCKSYILCKVYSSTPQRLSMNSGSGLRGASSCVKIILQAP